MCCIFIDINSSRATAPSAANHFREGVSESITYLPNNFNMTTLSTRSRLNLIFGFIIVLTLSFGLFIIAKSMKSGRMVKLIYESDAANYAECSAIISMINYLNYSKQEDLQSFSFMLDSTQRSVNAALAECQKIDDPEGERLLLSANAMLSKLLQNEREIKEASKANDAALGKVNVAFAKLLDVLNKQETIASADRKSVV